MSTFDILDYLNDMYMHKVAPDLHIQEAGGHNNIHGDSNQTDEKIMEINKKRIHIPNAQIKYFSHQRGDIEEYNEPETSSTGKHKTRENGKGYDKSLDEQDTTENSQVTEEVIEI